MEQLLTLGIALWLMAAGFKMMLRIIFPKFNYGSVGKPFKKGFKLLGKSGRIGKPLRKYLYTNQRDKRGRSFAWFHCSLIVSIVVTVWAVIYQPHPAIIFVFWGITFLLWRVHKWVKNYSKRSLPGRQRR